MFSIIKPGMPMASVDLTARKYCYEQLKAIGKLNSYEEIGKYMWHGGAHHIGYDVHDEVDMTRAVAPGMVFCVDIGIYDEDSGIGFRLEDNCLVTETGCENLSAAIPRKLEEKKQVLPRLEAEPVFVFLCLPRLPVKAGQAPAGECRIQCSVCPDL